MKNQSEKIFDELANSEDDVDKTIDKNNKNNTIRTIKGKEEKLAGFVFGYGHNSQAKFYNRTIDEIADFVGQKYSKEMRLAIGEEGQRVCARTTYHTIY